MYVIVYYLYIKSSLIKNNSLGNILHSRWLTLFIYFKNSLKSNPNSENCVNEPKPAVNCTGCPITTPLTTLTFERLRCLKRV